MHPQYHIFLVLVVLVVIFSLATPRSHPNQRELKCQVCDTHEGHADCFDLPNKKKYMRQLRMTALGWPMCFTIKSKDHTHAQRGLVNEFDGTEYWSATTATEKDNCTEFEDKNYAASMTICFCFKDNCNTA